MTALSQISAEVIRQEAAALHRFLAGSLWGVELEPVRLGADESPLVRAFWEEVGWDDQLSSDLGPPEREANARAVRRLLADYARSGSPLTAAALPARHRLVVADAGGAGLSVADESAGAADPPVVGFDADDGSAEPAGESYLRLVSFLLVYAAMRPWYQTAIETEPPLAELARDRPFPHLSPGTRRLTDDLWLFPNDADAPDPSARAGVRSFDGLWSWLAGAQGLRRLGIASLPGSSYRLTAAPEVVRAGTAGWREVEGIPPAIGYRAGTLDGARVVIQLGGPGRLACSARDEQAVLAALVARGWRAPGR